MTEFAFQLAQFSRVSINALLNHSTSKTEGFAHVGANTNDVATQRQIPGNFDGQNMTIHQGSKIRIHKYDWKLALHRILRNDIFHINYGFT